MYSQKFKNNLGILTVALKLRQEAARLKQEGEFVAYQEKLKQFLTTMDAVNFGCLIEELKEELPEWIKEAA